MDPAGFAERVRRAVAGRLLRERPPEEPPRWLEGWPGITVVDVRVEGTQPLIDLVVLFRAEARPRCLFGYRWTDIWTRAATDQEQESEPEPDEQAIVSFVRLFLINLEEQIEADDLGLPADCEPDGITWINGYRARPGGWRRREDP